LATLGRPLFRAYEGPLASATQAPSGHQSRVLMRTISDHETVARYASDRVGPAAVAVHLTAAAALRGGGIPDCLQDGEEFVERGQYREDAAGPCLRGVERQV